MDGGQNILHSWVRDFFGGAIFYPIFCCWMALCCSLHVWAQVPAHWEEETNFWSRNRHVNALQSSADLGNIYHLNTSELQQQKEIGQAILLSYPVAVTGMLIPYDSFNSFFNEKNKSDPLYQLLKFLRPWNSVSDLFQDFGFNLLPRESYPAGNMDNLSLVQVPNNLMGASLIERSGVKGLTFGCAACHSADLFGRKILGLTNKFPRPYELMNDAKKVTPYLNQFLYREVLHASMQESAMYQDTKNALKLVGVKLPEALGLDTSLAQVALSLTLRAHNGDAKSLKAEIMQQMPADSKPMVWWNAKYKTRFLSDGSLVSGNPIVTNILWNEIGRGTDLKKLNEWILNNQKILQQMTIAVFSTKAPRYTDFFGKNSIDVAKAKKGELHFIASCQKCHGRYEKNWETLENTKVTYFSQTPVINVGTDATRFKAISYFADRLNQLELAQHFQAVVVPQKGYVPPPLEGIWSRYPYLHNNSIPNLCQLLTPARLRVSSYYAGKALDQERDFDQHCVGYPLGEKVPKTWKKNKAYFFHATRVGLSNQGHDQGIFLNEQGEEIYSAAEKVELIEFLKTL